MKTAKFFTAGILMLSCLISTAQVPTNTNYSMPRWGVPVTTQRYYYLPGIQTYYDIPSKEYITLRNGMWRRSTTVPTAYRNYDFYKGRKVVINDYRGNAPYTYYNVHRVKYVPSPKPVYVHDTHKNHQGKGHIKARGKGHHKHHGPAKAKHPGKGHAKGQGKGHGKH